MFQEVLSSRWCVVLILLMIEFVLSAPQGYNYYTNQQRIYAQRAQAQRLQAQRIQAQNRYRQTYRPTSSSYAPNRNSVSRADTENAKFLGVRNQESEDRGKTLNHFRRKKQFAFGGNPCYFRSADQQPAEGRFLWDLNVYNVYPPSYGGGAGCGGGGGFGNRPFGGGFFQNFLSLFVPGGALNQNVAPLRPLQSNIQSDSTGSGGLPAGVQNDYDPNLDGTGSGGSTGSVGSTGSIGAVGGAPSLTPGQLVGGVATTVNGIIQQLTGNVQPVYRRYG